MIRLREKAALALLTASVTAAVAIASGQNPPEVERGETILNGSCATCHDLRPVEVQAQDKEGWTKIVDSMIEKGATVGADDVPVLVDYLVANHGPLPDGPGKEILLNNCTLCHDLKRVRRHGATREEWEETLAAMLNEGAMLNETEFPVLLNYLARNFRPQ